MSTAISNLRDETISQARIEAQRVLKWADEADFSLSVSGMGSEQMGDALNQVISRVLRALAQGQSIDIQPVPRDLTTTVAAQRIGISRPMLMKAIRSGELPAHKVGSHFRIRPEDADTFRKNLLAQKVAENKRALQELWAFEEENNLDEILGGPAW
ncbi:excisionase family DNA-binding protein [Rothia aeria]|jgi:toxin-antitoxin system, antitoxin component, merR family|uniref:excisionase family DNA-binding protein n=1 Tax=Rothia aeria TaxID=172042 RepID=UPI00254CA172|nr:excisionase family DNA-binding protein [Rothia aeria]MDK7352117.1 excisionase family DNA-binding protein [Rothia aeria]